MKNQVILATNPKRSLTLIVRFDEDLRHLDCQPFVVCFRYDSINQDWELGHYFDSLRDALDYLKN